MAITVSSRKSLGHFPVSRPSVYVCYIYTPTRAHVGILHANTHVGQQLKPLDVNYTIYGDSFNVSTSARAQTFSLTAKTKRLTERW